MILTNNPIMKNRAAKRKEAASLTPAKWITVQLLVTLIKGQGI